MGSVPRPFISRSLLGIIFFLRSLYYKLAKFKNFKLFRATGPVFGTARPKDSVSGQGRWGGCIFKVPRSALPYDYVKYNQHGVQTSKLLNLYEITRNYTVQVPLVGGGGHVHTTGPGAGCFAVESGAPCVFPFAFQGATYTGCTRDSKVRASLRPLCDLTLVIHCAVWATHVNQLSYGGFHVLMMPCWHDAMLA